MFKITQPLWDSVKIASDKEIHQIPDQMNLNNERILKDEIPETFANYFQGKVNNLAQTCNIDQNVYNGETILHASNENFMTELNIMQILISN